MTSKGKKAEQKKADNRESGAGSVAALILVAMIFLIPIGLCFYTAPAEPYTTIPEDPLLTAVHNAGASICSTKDTQWNVPGATGGNTYVVSTNCNVQTSANTITVQVQTFDSVESRDAAVRTYNTMTVGRGKPVGNLFAYGQYLIYVTPPNTALMRDIQAEIQKMKATS